MTPRRRTLGLTAAALAVVVTAATFAPQGGPEPAIETSGSKGAPQAAPAPGPGPGQTLTATAGAITPDLQKEIDRVVEAGQTQGKVLSKANTLVASQVRCADFEGQRYCLGQGWTTESEGEVQARMSTELSRASTRSKATETTGDLDPATLLQRRATLTPSARAAAERRELTEAARSVAKVWLLRHQVQGVPLPEGFFQRHPEVRALSTEPGTSRRTTTQPATATHISAKPWSTYPDKAAVISTKMTAEQTTTYWCGPTTMQMIGWGWERFQRSQSYWAKQLGTTRSGTSITEMVRVVNARTGWDNADRAGKYIVLDISTWNYASWFELMMRHIYDCRAPVIMHPVLRKEFFPYLDDDASGHFQVGRGYRKNTGTGSQVGIFEPWNQQRFDPSEPYIARVQWHSAYKQYRANRAHFQHNIGV